MGYKNKKDAVKYHKEYNKKYYLENKEKIDKKNKLYAQNNRAKMVKNVQRYVKNNITTVKTYRKKYEISANGYYRRYKHSAEQRGYEFILDLKEFENIINNNCLYCGESEERIGMDRIDNSLGYFKDNCAPCCPTCNYMKKTLTKEEFLNHIEKIYKYNN